mmetsp:Transcript_145907/g.406411  ORF Transcript_145907/g.406411 Transcript_145907/m.406411 type:complete len:157 (+) Transcript_145907:128-598(+)
MIGAVFQVVWFCLCSYVLLLQLLDIARPWVFLEGSPLLPILRASVACLLACIVIRSAPRWLCPCAGAKAVLARRCKCLGSPRAPAVVMTVILPLMVGRAQQYHLALDENNYSWGWAISLVCAAAMLNSLVWVLLTLVWILTCGPCRRRPEKVEKTE